ncbi:hypothetical protein TYRP_001812 [Tyrophagus putrescentiae]|nr:hypothetical protein TYRP_001812 [Tyrophagus putrescentiae]
MAGCTRIEPGCNQCHLKLAQSVNSRFIKGVYDVAWKHSNQQLVWITHFPHVQHIFIVVKLQLSYQHHHFPN